ncbi:MAG: hypothetical protein JXR07_04985 [Reichenbachiella sp.]
MKNILRTVAAFSLLFILGSCADQEDDLVLPSAPDNTILEGGGGDPHNPGPPLPSTNG